MSPQFAVVTSSCFLSFRPVALPGLSRSHSLWTEEQQPDLSDRSTEALPRLEMLFDCSFPFGPHCTTIYWFLSIKQMFKY